MTLIAYKDGMMAADGVVFTGDIMSRSTTQKILRMPGVGLIGASGFSSDCWAVHQWFLAGREAAIPFLQGTDREHEVDVLWARPDGTLWRNSGGVAIFYPVPLTFAIGDRTAACVAETAMRLGKSAEEAVHIACEMCAAIRGPVQVERLLTSPCA